VTLPIVLSPYCFDSAWPVPPFFAFIAHKDMVKWAMSQWVVDNKKVKSPSQWQPNYLTGSIPVKPSLKKLDY